MQLSEAKRRFIQAWGTLGSKWGVNRTMAQVHALLLISPDALSADDVMTELNISRGNANMNLRALIDWNLIKKQLKSGDRKEYFFAEKDIWKAAQQIMTQRKKRELEPIRQILTELKNVEGNDPYVDTFKSTINDINEFANAADKFLEKMAAAERNLFLQTLIKLMSK